MKKSVSLSLFDAPPMAPILFSSRIEENIPAIKELGYDGVDLFVLDPAADVSQRAKILLRENDLGVGVVMPAALAGEGLFLSHKDPDVRREILRRMREIMAYAAEVNGMVSLGLVRGSCGSDETMDEVMKRFAGTIEELIPASREYGVDLLVEPINRYEINTLNESCESYDFIRESGLPLYLMLDTFHMNMEDLSITGSLEYCRDLIKHVHFVDSNRLAPGMGHLDMGKIYDVLKKQGYGGYLCLEALSRPDSITCARKGMEFFRQAESKTRQGRAGERVHASGQPGRNAFG